MTNPLLDYFSEDELWRVAMVTVCLLLALAVFIYMLAHEDARRKYLNNLMMLLKIVISLKKN